MRFDDLGLFLFRHLFPFISIDDHKYIVPTYPRTFIFIPQHNNILQNAQILPTLLVHDNAILGTHMHVQIIKTELTVSLNV
jgi:hypothetical protein